MTRPLRIGSRGSKLALWQAQHVAHRLRLCLPGMETELLALTTEGDRRLGVSLAKIGGKGLFVKELEQALADDRADIAVHSMKDVPMHLPPGFVIAAVLSREDPRDAFVSNRFTQLVDMPAGSRVGTSSLRRESQLRARHPALTVVPLRGNVQTRLRKLDEGQYDAIVLAAAGLKRLGLASRIRATFDATAMLPAAGQGALGLEVRSNRHDLIDALAPLAHQPTWLTVVAERAVSRAMGGSCSMPLAAHGLLDDDGTLQLDAAWGDPEGQAPLVRAQAQAPVSTLAQAEALGNAVAERLRAGGARGVSPTGH